MSTTEIALWAVVAVIVVAAALTAWLLWHRKRTESLREDFGSEYDRAVEETGDPRRAEKELEQRKKRFERLDVRPLAPEERTRFARRWQTVQGEFVDHPEEAVDDAHLLVEEVLQARGYPLERMRQRQADISVENPDVVPHYRQAWEIHRRSGRGEASTEDRRLAMKHYRALFTALLEGGESGEEGVDPRKRKEAVA